MLGAIQKVNVDNRERYKYYREADRKFLDLFYKKEPIEAKPEALYDALSFNPSVVGQINERYREKLAGDREADTLEESDLYQRLVEEKLLDELIGFGLAARRTSEATYQLALELVEGLKNLVVAVCENYYTYHTNKAKEASSALVETLIRESAFHQSLDEMDEENRSLYNEMLAKFRVDEE